MSVIERDVVLIGKDKDGNECIDLPVTRLGNIEDTAGSKETLADGDCIPLVDSADNGKMKKIPWSAVKNTMPANFTVTVTDSVADKTFAEIAAAVDAGKSIRLLYVDTTTGAEELLTFAGYGQDHDFLCFFNIIDSYLRLIEIRSDEALNVYEGAISLSGHDHDNRYLKLTGGTVNGDVTIGKDHALTITSSLDFYSGDGGISICDESEDAEHPVLSFYGMNGDENVWLNRIETPVFGHQAANKKYVDDAVKGSNSDELKTFARKRTIVFSESDTWVAPDNIINNEILVLASGGGGGGGGKYDSDASYGGGGGSGYITMKKLTVTPGESYDIVIGAGGAAGAGTSATDISQCTGGRGGTTTFGGSLVTALGGYGGTGGDVNEPGDGGNGNAGGGGYNGGNGDTYGGGGGAYSDGTGGNGGTYGGGGGCKRGTPGTGGTFGGDAGQNGVRFSHDAALFYPFVITNLEGFCGSSSTFGTGVSCGGGGFGGNGGGGDENIASGGGGGFGGNGGNCTAHAGGGGGYGGNGGDSTSSSPTKGFGGGGGLFHDADDDIGGGGGRSGTAGASGLLIITYYIVEDDV